MAEEALTKKENDFATGSIAKTILRLAIPLTLAQLIYICYNLVDRLFIGHIAGVGTVALTGVGVVLPAITIITAFADLCGTGGAPLCSICRGAGKKEEAEQILGNAFTMLLVLSVLLMVVLYLIRVPLLRAFGASDATLPYAVRYLSIYLLGTVFVLISLGMNPFINAQGFAKTGMMTVSLGAVLNIVLDPLFIFVFHWGVSGAAAATVVSEIISTIWVLRFLTGPRAIQSLRRCYLRPKFRTVLRITTLGLTGFTMALTNSLVQIVGNTSLRYYGGDAYVGVMTIINTVREVASRPAYGLVHAMEPVIGFNYGAGNFSRVRKGIFFTSVMTFGYTAVAWILILIFPAALVGWFDGTGTLSAIGVPSMRMYFAAFFMMAAQFCGQSTYVGLGKAKYAVFFSLFRKAIVVVPLMLILPHFTASRVMGVFLAEPISDVVGGGACFLTMMLAIWRTMGKEKTPVYETH